MHKYDKFAKVFANDRLNDNCEEYALSYGEITEKYSKSIRKLSVKDLVLERKVTSENVIPCT